MRKLQALLTLTAAIVYADQSFAGPKSAAVRAADSESVRSFDNVFSDASSTSKVLNRGRYEKAPSEVRGAVAANYATYKNEDYFNMSSDGRSAALIAPNSSTDRLRSSVSAVHTEPGTNFTLEFSISNKKNPTSVEIGPEHELPMEGVKDGHFGYPLSYKGKHIHDGYYMDDMVPSVPVRQTYDLPKYEIKETTVYTVLSEGSEDRRFTAHNRLSVRQKSFENEERGALRTYPDGHQEWFRHAKDLNLSARMYRESATDPIETASLLLKLRNQSGTTIKYELPKRADGKVRQIQDIKFTDNLQTDQQTMHVIASDGERLNYNIVKDGEEAKIVFKDADRAEMSEYIARKRSIKNRVMVGDDAAAADAGR